MRFSVLCLALVMPAPAPAPATVTLSPFHDTWVNSAAPTATYGNYAYLSAENTTSAVERSYLEFDTASLAGLTVSSAVLRLWVIRENAGGAANDVFEVYPIYSAWTDGLTYNEAPLLTKGPLAASVPSTDYGIDNTTSPPRAVDFDITAVVQSWASGGINEGLLVQLPLTANADYRFASLDDPNAALRPSLTVTTSDTAAPAPAPGPAPVPTAVSNRDNDNGDTCGCGVATAPWNSPLIGLLALGLLALVGRRVTP
jgi:hypothetical protein